VLHSGRDDLSFERRDLHDGGAEQQSSELSGGARDAPCCAHNVLSLSPQSSASLQSSAFSPQSSAFSPRSARRHAREALG
jgi:hypothetical protein